MKASIKKTKDIQTYDNIWHTIIETLNGNEQKELDDITHLLKRALAPLTKKPLEALVSLDPSADLLRVTPSPSLRAHILFRLSPAPDRSKFAEALSKSIGLDSQHIRRNTWEALAPNNSKTIASVFKAANLPEETVKTKMVQLTGADPSRWREFFDTRKFSGEGALSELEQLINNSRLKSQPGVTPTRKFYQTEKRAKLLYKIETWLQPNRDDKRIVLNVYQDRTTLGLTACAGEILRRIEARCAKGQEPREILFLSLYRASTPEGPVPDLQTVLGRLHHFYTRGIDGIEDAPPKEDLWEILDEIRNKMIESPSVLILDGLFQWRPFNSKFQNVSVLERSIADRHFLRILSRLLTPPTTALDARRLRKWQENRILITSNFDVTKHGDLARYMPDSMMTAEKLTDPKSEDGPEIVGTLGLQYGDQIVETLHTYTRASFTDSDYLMLDALISSDPRYLDQKKDQFRDIKRRFAAAEREDEPHPSNWLIDRFLTGLSKANTLQYKILFLISLVPDGMRRQTVKRIVNRCVDGGSPDAPFARSLFIKGTHPMEEKKGLVLRENVDVTVDAEIDELLHAYRTIVHEKVSDQISGFDEDTDGSANAVSISFALPGVNADFHDHFMKSLPENEICYAYRSIADEAFRQAGAVFRSQDIARSTSIRPWRRFISAIYYGLQSLNIQHKRELSEAKSAKENDLPTPEIFLNEGPDLSGVGHHGPSDPDDYWSWLYWFAFRQVLDGRPIYRISRVLGFESLKRELLLLFDRPFEAWSEKRLGNRDFGDLRLIHPKSGVLGYGSTSFANYDEKAVVHRYYISRIRSHLARFEMTDANIDLAQATSDYNKRAARSNDTLNPSQDRAKAPNRAALIEEWAQIFRHALEISSLTLGPLEQPPQASGQMPLPPDTSDIRLSGSLRNVIDCLIDGLNIDWPTQNYISKELKIEVTKTLEILKDPNFAAPQSGSPIRQEIYKVARKQPPGNSRSLIRLAQLLSRLGEYIANVCEVADVTRNDQLTLADLNQTIPDDFPIPSSALFISPWPEKDWLLWSAYALAMLKLGETLRLAMFSANPASSEYIASGRSMWAYNRALLLFARLERRQRSSEFTFRENFFARVARQQIDVSSRHFYALPAERAGLLLLQSELERSVPIGDPIAGLNRSRKNLMNAEIIILQQGRDYSSRLRLYFERVETHLELANLTQDHGKYRSLMDLEIDLIDKILSSGNSPREGNEFVRYWKLRRDRLADDRNLH